MTDRDTLRERRRARILNNSEDRLNKLLGYKNRPEALGQASSVPEPKQDGSDPFNLGLAEHFTADSDYKREISTNETETFGQDNSNGEATWGSSAIGMLAEGFHAAPNKESDTGIEEDDKSNSILRFRYLTMLVLGVLVRLILESPLKMIIFRENILFQFILVQAMFLGLQKRPNEALIGTSLYGIGFIYFKLLQFVGISEKWLRTFQQLSSLACAVTTDFCIYMFSFTLVHSFIG